MPHCFALPAGAVIEHAGRALRLMHSTQVFESDEDLSPRLDQSVNSEAPERANARGLLSRPESKN